MGQEAPRYEIDIFYSTQDEAYIANVPELVYCSAWGGSYEEALAQVQVAMKLYLQTLQAEGRPIPSPRVSRIS